MISVAITGTYCSGKSFVLYVFSKCGIPTFDSDKVVGDILLKDNGVIHEVGKICPESLMGKKINKSKLSKAVFSDSKKLKSLEGVIYPLLFIEEEEFLNRNSKSFMVAVEVPLLFEKGLSLKYGFVITTYSSKSSVLKRSRDRGMGDAMTELILSHQLPDELKKTKANYIINSELEKKEVEGEVFDIIKDIKERS